MILKFDTYGNEKQKDCVRAWNDNTITEIVYGGSKGSAKSFTGCSLIFGDALMYPRTHYYIARKVLKDLRAFTIPSIYEVFDIWGLDKETYLKFNGQDSFFSLPNESRVYLMDAKYVPSDPDYERFGSMQFTRGWIEEAGEFEEACKENLQASLGRKENKKYNLVPKLLQTCNPTKGYLYKDYKANKKGELDSHKKFIQALPQDNKRLGDQYIENLHKTLTGARKERLLFGNWEFDDDPSKLLTIDNINDAFTNDHIEPTGKRYLTCDIAYEGSDQFVIVAWNGWIIEEIICIPKSTGKEVLDEINRVRKLYKIPMSRVLFDKDGSHWLGSFLQGAKGFVNNSKPKKVKGKEQKFRNLASQCGYMICEKIRDGEIYIADPTHREKITQELEQIKNHNHGNDEPIHIKKSEIKKLLGRSPDFFDAIKMRVYFELYKAGELKAYS